MTTSYDVTLFPRQEFLERYWDYRPGEHVTILAPTDGGKTQFAHELVAHAATPDLPCVELVMKPRDSTVSRWIKPLGFRRVTTWPPMPHPLYRRPPGWALWPKHAYDPARDNIAHYRVFRAAILDSYKRGQRIILADETVGLVDLGLSEELSTVWTKGRSMDCGLWAASQRPKNIPLAAYSQASHLFLGNNPDAQDRKRYAEIGGIDPKQVSEIVANLNRFQWLYIKRKGEEGAEACIVDR